MGLQMTVWNVWLYSLSLIVDCVVIVDCVYVCVSFVSVWMWIRKKTLDSYLLSCLCLSSLAMVGKNLIFYLGSLPIDDPVFLLFYVLVMPFSLLYLSLYAYMCVCVFDVYQQISPLPHPASFESYLILSNLFTRTPSQAIGDWYALISHNVFTTHWHWTLTDSQSLKVSCHVAILVI